MFDPENMLVAVRILFLASLEAEIHLGVVYTPSTQISNNVNQVAAGHMKISSVNVKTL